MNYYRTRLLASTFFGAMLSAVFLQSAQAQTAPPPEPAVSSELEQITVTGSRIASDRLSTPTAVDVLPITELQDSGPNDIGDALVKLPEFRNSTSPNNGGGQFTNTRELNLQGIGSNRTLILLDGVRVPPTDPTGGVN